MSFYKDETQKHILIYWTLLLSLLFLLHTHTLASQQYFVEIFKDKGVYFVWHTGYLVSGFGWILTCTSRDGRGSKVLVTVDSPALSPEHIPSLNQKQTRIKLNAGQRVVGRSSWLVTMETVVIRVVLVVQAVLSAGSLERPHPGPDPGITRYTLTRI